MCEQQEEVASDCGAQEFADFLVCDMNFRFRLRSFGSSESAPQGEMERVLPVLFIRLTDGSVTISQEALAWAQKLVRDDAIAAPRPKIAAVGRLYAFIRTTAGTLDDLSPDEMDALIYAYLGSRLAGSPEGHADGGSSSITLETAQSEFAYFAQFSRFCASFTGTCSPIGAAFRANGHFWQTAKALSKPDSFFAHLRARQQLIQDRFDARPAFPKTLTRGAVRSSRRIDQTTTTMSPEQVDAIIDGERNVVYKSLWTLLAYAGPRLSEALNLWRCDVLPGSYSRYFSEIDMTGLPLVIFAHPSRSTYVGDVTSMKREETRRTYLNRIWGLKPRPFQSSKKRPGWKGMLFFNETWLLSWAYWTSKGRAAEFARLGSEIRAIHKLGNVDLRHPFYFCNSKHRDTLYQPLSVRAAEQAFDAACLRVGIEPHVTVGAHIHGLRHFYEWYMEWRLGLPPEKRQILLRHRSIRSQEAYGRRAVDTYHSLTKLYLPEKKGHDDTHESR